MVPVSDQDMNTHLAELSRVRPCGRCDSGWFGLFGRNSDAFCCLTFAATHGQAEHSGGLTPAVPVRQQVLRRGKGLLRRPDLYLKVCRARNQSGRLSPDHPVPGGGSGSPEQTADAPPPTDRRRSGE